MRERLTRAWIDLAVLRAHTLRALSGPEVPGNASVVKLLWSRWRQNLGDLAMDVVGPADVGGEEVERWRRLFLFSRADTIYGGSNEIQRTIVAERVLGLPRDRR
jgi:alkylation response protein AidB-like acyl-CoA dehydrogenase